MAQAIAAALIAWGLYRKESKANGVIMPNTIAKSQETGGALHISAEALRKIEEVKRIMLTEKSHIQICRANLGDFQIAVRDIVDDRIEKLETRILNAIKNNGK